MIEQLRVLVADDHAPTREDVRDALEADGGFVVCAEAFDAPGAVDAALRERPDLCLLDVHMPGSGISAAWEIAASLPETRIVMLTISSSDTHLFSALRAGASGYLLKDLDLARLPDALLALASGEPAIPRRLVMRLVDDLRDRGARRRAVEVEGGGERLTSREWQVLDLLRQGMSTAQIARRLVLAPATVRTHIASIIRKFSVTSREEVLRLFADDETGVPASVAR